MYRGVGRRGGCDECEVVESGVLEEGHYHAALVTHGYCLVRRGGEYGDESRKGHHQQHQQRHQQRCDDEAFLADALHKLAADDYSEIIVHCS